MASAVEWVYSAGTSWAPLDQYTQSMIEALFSRNAASWVHSSPSFGNQPVFIDTAELILMYSGCAYTIARRMVPNRSSKRR